MRLQWHLRAARGSETRHLMLPTTHTVARQRLWLGGASLGYYEEADVGDIDNVNALLWCICLFRACHVLRLQAVVIAFRATFLQQRTGCSVVFKVRSGSGFLDNSFSASAWSIGNHHMTPAEQHAFSLG